VSPSHHKYFCLFISLFTSAFMDRVEEGTVQFTANKFPSFVYETGTNYDEDNEDLGLFRGFLLVRVCIFKLL
jgi:hypothetical protein